MQSYYDLLGRANNVAATPYQAYTGDLTAPINAQQTSGINNINQNAGFAQPYIQQAAGYANNAAQPLTQSQIQQYQSPYTQSVVDSTSAWFNNQNQQQQQNVLGNAASQGALGGDRVGVAQANLAAQQTASQAPVIAGLYNQGYQQAVGVAQQQQQNQANAAYSLGNLGVAGQNAALTGANAQVGAGSLEQQNQQQQLNALYQQYQIGQAFPYQQTQWLAGVDTGVGSQLGGNSSTTAPAPNPWAQYAGVGLTAASMFMKKGGAVPGFAPGGMAGDAPFGGVGWIPGRSITMGRGAPPPPGVTKQPDGMADLSKGMNAFAKAANQPEGVGAPMDLSASGVAGFSPSSVGSTFSPGQFDMAGTGLSGIYRNGGRIPGFAPGGTVADDLSFADRWAPTVGAVSDGTFDPQGLNSRADNFDYTPTVSDAGAVPVRTISLPRPDAASQVAGFSPAETAANARDDMLADAGDTNQPALGFAPDQQPADQLPGGEGALPFASIPDLPRPDPSTFETPQPSQEKKRSGFGLGLLPDNLRMPLMMAGLGMMASRSPNLGNAIGEGGIAGVQAYTQQKQAELQHAEKKQTFEQQNRKIDLEAKKLQDAAETSRKTLAEHSRHNLATEGFTAQQRDVQEMQPVKIGTDALGRDTYAVRDSKTHQLVPIDPATGRPPVAPPPPAPNYVVPGATPKPATPGDEAALPANAQPVSGGHAEGTNPDVLEPLPKGIANTVKAIAEGRQSLQTVPMRDRRAYQNWVNEYDPNWDQTVWRARNNMAADLATGNTGKLVLATNQLLPHLKTASDKAEALNNAGYPAANSIANWWLTNTGDPRVKEFDTVRTVAATDAARLLRGTGAMSIEEIRGWEERLKNSGSPAQLQGVLSMLGDDLIGARVSSIQHQYQTVMHKPAPDFVSPDAKAALTTLRARDPNNKDRAGAPAAPAHAAAVSPQDKQALDWANANPADPRAAAIKKRLGAP